MSTTYSAISFRCCRDARRDRQGPRPVGLAQVEPQHRARSQTLVLQAEISSGQARHRKASVRTSGLHQEDRHHGDEGRASGEGGREEPEVEDEREGPAEAGQDRHRLPEVARRLLQVADQAEDDLARRPLLRRKGV